MAGRAGVETMKFGENVNDREIYMVLKDFLKKLEIIAAETISGGFDSFEVEHEDEDVDLYFCTGSSGVGQMRNDLREGLWELNQKDLSQIKQALKCKSIKMRDYDHFGANARNLRIFV